MLTESGKKIRNYIQQSKTEVVRQQSNMEVVLDAWAERCSWTPIDLCSELFLLNLVFPQTGAGQWYRQCM